MIDFHCHLDLYPDPRAVLDGIDARGTYVLAVTTTPKAWHNAIRKSRFSAACYRKRDMSARSGSTEARRTGNR